MERIPADGWQSYAGHVDRYRMAADLCAPGDRVLDVACGVGYGAQVLAAAGVDYTGVDLPGVADPRFAGYGTFVGADLDEWTPQGRYDLGVCFETLEHVADPVRLAGLLDGCCDRLIVSVPTVPTVGVNPHHRHDFTLDSLLALFPHRPVLAVVPQPAEVSHVVAFGERE